MAFMRPVASFFAAYHVETDMGTEIVPEDVCGELMCLPGDWVSEDEYPALADYLEGRRIESAERREGWYARLSAPGFLDATDWDGPHATADEALASVKDSYQVNDNGDSAEDDGDIDGNA